MPFSSNTYEPLIEGIISLIKPKKFLDIGPGAGKYGKILKNILNFDNFNCHLTAVEYDINYIKEYNLQDIYHNVINMDARDLLSISHNIDADLCIIGDMIEHLPKSDGIDLINYLLYRIKTILLIIPQDLYQDEWQGHSQEAHVSNWYPSDFSEFNSQSYVCKSFGSINFMLVVLNGNQIPKKDWLAIYDNNDDGISYGYPYKYLNSINLDIIEEDHLAQRLVLTSDLSSSCWTSRGEVTIEELKPIAPDGISTGSTINFFGVGDIWFITKSLTGKIYYPSFYIKNNFSHGCIQICNPINLEKGLYEIDLSLLNDKWNLITFKHESVKVIYPFSAFNKKMGFHIRNINKDKINFSIWNPQI